MRMSLAAVTALAGSLLLPVLLLGSAQAVTSSLDFKNAISSTVTLTPVRGGGGEFAGGVDIWEVTGLAVIWADSAPIWVAWVVVILVEWVAIWVVLPFVPSMVDPDLPVGSLITLVIGTS